jgi:hypothetical protein
VLGPVGDHILQDFKTLFLTRFRTYKIATQHETKTPVKTTFRDWCLYSSFIHEKRIRLGGQSRGEGDPKGGGGAMARGVPKGIVTPSVGDPEPPDLHVFGPPGSGFICQRYGSGSGT